MILRSEKEPIDVLKFWHLVEFFVPFDLDEVLSKSNAAYQITEDELRIDGNDVLPWVSQCAFAKANCQKGYEYRYNLYLLPFDKNEITKISKEIFPLESDLIKQIEFEEKFSDEGKTCFARLPIDTKGQLNFGNISISTLPWAIGRLIERNFSALNYKNYEQEQNILRELFRSLASYLDNPESQVVPDSIKPNVLTATSLLILIDTFKKWAGFSPDYPFAVIFEAIKVKPKVMENCLTSNSLVEIKTIDDDLKKNSPAEIEESLDILNSFFIQDIENVINDLHNNENKTLISYITGTADQQKTDLYAKDNSLSIINKSNPCYLNSGKWPVKASQFMSLMQQFAINECFYPSNESSLFSVNGPPGTGKTTLLQDIIAENIVRRARILVGFEVSTQAFVGKRSVNFLNGETTVINVLDERLTGFEMLVVSSNNAAVENISKELPLKKKLPKEYQEFCNYLSAVAFKTSAEFDKTEGKILPLSSESNPWGLISVALGNSKNRRKFRDRAFFSPGESKEESKRRVQKGEFLTIWEWSKQYKGITFKEAKDSFLEADKKYHSYLDKIKQLADLHHNLFALNMDVYESENNAKINELCLEKAYLLAQEKENTELLKKSRLVKEQICEDLEQHKKFKPSLLERIFRTQNAKDYKSQLIPLRKDWNNILEQEKELKIKSNKTNSRLTQIKKDTATILQKLEIKKQEHANLQKSYHALSNLLPNIILPPIDNDLEKTSSQLEAFWQNDDLNKLRINLFISSMKLHEAWLAEVLKNKHFGGNLFAISRLLDNTNPAISADEIHIWQSVFMWVPVISSTFASVARQFKNIGSQQLGWVLIDEAGQAIPQAAVGAIWRAKNILVVGDPLQIEPVFTIPPNLVEGLAEYCLKKNYQKWLPTSASIQTLADDANKLGVYIDVLAKQWIGCPLRIHRRCLDPMFSVANQIAYGNKMHNARGSDGSSDNYYLGESCWYNVSGETSDKQYVQAQGEFLLKLFIQLYEHNQKLPKLYIITPFKRIKQNLQKLIENTENWSMYLSPIIKLPDKQKLKVWCAKHIGTVHTFQGKETDMVIFVLGANHNNHGAANWASSKPNLLNVALTRARDRVYLIGDRDLWASKNYFSELANSLCHKKVGAE